LFEVKKLLKKTKRNRDREKKRVRGRNRRRQQVTGFLVGGEI